MEEKSIPWTMWDYKGGFGLFKKNSSEIFEHDLNVPLLEKLDFNVPEQTPYQKKSERTSLVVYDDYPGRGIVNASHISSGTLDFYSGEQAEGDYCLCWSDVGQYDGIVFDFKPEVDFSKLKEHNFELSFKVRSNASSVKFDARLVDTKANATDRPWRMGVTIDDAMANFDGEWHEVRIPLSDLVEKGAWDEAWYEPGGLFDWENIDRFEIVPEHQPLTGLGFCFDDIRIVGEDIPEEIVTGVVDSELLSLMVFPNPSAGGFTIQHSEIDTEVRIYDQLGMLVRTLRSTMSAGEIATVHWDSTSSQGSPVAPGLYIIRVGSGNAEYVKKVIVR
jgi:endoglucanase